MRVIIALAAFNNNAEDFNVKLYLAVFLLLIICNENSPEFDLKRIFKYVLIPTTYEKAVNDPKRNKY